MDGWVVEEEDEEDEEKEEDEEGVERSMAKEECRGVRESPRL